MFAALDELESPLFELSDLLEVLSEELFVELSEELSEELFVELSEASVTFFFLPVLKSVSYQPAPFSLNAAADTSLVSFGWSQAGQSRSRSSLIFCSFSSLCPQASH